MSNERAFYIIDFTGEAYICGRDISKLRISSTMQTMKKGQDRKASDLVIRFFDVRC